MAPETIKLERTNYKDENFKKLVLLLDKDLAVRNGDTNDFFAQYNNIDKINNVVLAFKGRIPVGCGGFKEYNKKTVEVKRMYVPPEKRGSGIASSILTELETWAKELGYESCILETGDKMPEAIALYKKRNYKIIPNYGQYQEVDSSICFEKKLE